MKSLLTLILAFTLILGTSYWYLHTATICPIPISYRLGDIDPRFAITETEARQVLKLAESVWEEAVQNDLFFYDETSTFSLNFIYDERQQLASTEEEWRMTLDAKEKKSKDFIEQVKLEAVTYEIAQAAYAKNREQYEKKLSEYNQTVEAYNRQGGAPPADFTILEAEKEVLAKMLGDLLEVEKELKKIADKLNLASIEGNRLVESYNVEVLQYNEIYGDLDIYTQGDFIKDRINIYKFSDSTELKKVVTHEFGHALGLGHVEGSDSIMYYLMEDQPDPIRLTEADLEAFYKVCGDQDSFGVKLRGAIRQLLDKL